MCACGREFFNSDGGWDWEEGELDKLLEDPNTTNLEYSVGFVEFEGVSYVMACDCWVERAEQVCNFIDGHAHEIASYLTLEKDLAVAKAAAMPTV
jgi:hypothetical protein